MKSAINVKSNCYLREKTKKNSQIVQTGHRRPTPAILNMAQPAAICDPPSNTKTAATSQAGHYTVLIFAPAKGSWSKNDERPRKYYVRKVWWGGKKRETS